MLIGVFTGLIDVERVVRVLEGGNAQSTARQEWNDLDEERRLSRATPSHDAENLGHTVVYYDCGRANSNGSRDAALTDASSMVLTESTAEGVVGVVIAGGRSLRFGGEKAAAALAGKPLLMWAVARLQRSCRAVAVNARAGTEAQAIASGAGLPVLHDLEGDPLGPLAGVKVGLMWARKQGAKLLAVSPCDVPMLPQDLFPKLIQAAASSGAAMAETRDGLQPLCAVWPVSALQVVSEALTGGRHPATWMMLERLGAQRVHFESAAAFANINTRSDLTSLASRLELDAANPTARPPDDDRLPRYQR